MILDKNNLNKSHGYYFGSYDISIDKYSGVDFSKKCFIFPGQGIAFPGMFKEQYLDFKVIREKFDQADFLAKKFKIGKISNYIINPEKVGRKKLPIVRNLALFTLEVVLCELLISRRIIPKIVTGHSFGEYAVLVVSGIISFEEMFDIVYHRDFFSPEVNSLGFMIAISVDEDEIKNILKKSIGSIDIEMYRNNLNFVVEVGDYYI